MSAELRDINPQLATRNARLTSGDKEVNLTHLNERQKEAVLAKGIIRVIAGAGQERPGS